MIVSFHELAERELNEAAEYFTQRQPGLGSAFIAEVQRCSDAILQHPQAGPIILGTTRRQLCRRFPYALLYTSGLTSYDSGGDESEATTRILGGAVVMKRPNTRCTRRRRVARAPHTGAGERYR